MLPGYTLKNTYVFEKLIGSGGMGEVWSAKRSTLGDRVAIKVLKLNSFQDKETIREQLKKEAKITSILNHPNICKVFDLIEQDDTCFLIMELLEGVDLQALLSNSKLINGIDREKLALHVTKQVLRALNSAHNINHPTIARILHRDIKPSNIFLTKHGEVKLLDLGVAKIETDLDNTKTSNSFYSLHYTSPDLWEDGIYNVGKYSTQNDIYSLGLVFYELISGEKAFPGEGKELYEQLEKGVLPSLENLNLSPETKKILRKWTNKSPKERFQNVKDLLNEIENQASKIHATEGVILDVFRNENNPNLKNIDQTEVSKSLKKNQNRKTKLTVFLITLFFLVLGGGVIKTQDNKKEVGHSYLSQNINKNLNNRDKLDNEPDIKIESTLSSNIVKKNNEKKTELKKLEVDKSENNNILDDIYLDENGLGLLVSNQKIKVYLGLPLEKIKVISKLICMENNGTTYMCNVLKSRNDFLNIIISDNKVSQITLGVDDELNLKKLEAISNFPSYTIASSIASSITYSGAKDIITFSRIQGNAAYFTIQGKVKPISLEKSTASDQRVLNNSQKASVHPVVIKAIEEKNRGNIAKAKGLYLDLCESDTENIFDIGTACMSLADIERKEGLPREAKKHYTLACRCDFPLACEYAGELGIANYEGINTVPEFSHGCDLGSGFSCYRLACLVVDKSKKGALRYLEKSLSFGFSDWGKIEDEQCFKSIKEDEGLKKLFKKYNKL